MYQGSKILLFLIIILLQTSSCEVNFFSIQPSKPVPTSTPSPTPTPTPTFTPPSTPTPTATNTSVHPTSPPSIIGPDFPDSPEAQDIIETIENAYDIDIEASVIFDLSKLSSVYINDPLFEMNQAVLQTVRELTGDLSIETAGFLDYKLAYYGWKRDSILHKESVYATAEAENRGLTEDERSSLIDEFGRSAPSRGNYPFRKTPILFLTLDIDEDIARLVIDYGFARIEIMLVYVNNQWFIADQSYLSISP